MSAGYGADDLISTRYRHFLHIPASIPISSFFLFVLILLTYWTKWVSRRSVPLSCRDKFILYEKKSNDFYRLKEKEGKELLQSWTTARKYWFNDYFPCFHCRRFIIVFNLPLQKLDQAACCTSLFQTQRRDQNAVNRIGHVILGLKWTPPFVCLWKRFSTEKIEWSKFVCLFYLKT